MKRICLGACWLAGWLAQPAAGDIATTLRLAPQWHSHNAEGVLAPAGPRLASGAERITGDVEMAAGFKAVSGILTLRHTAIEDGDPSTELELNELYANANRGGWYFSAGKKVVSWDVGQAFRPLDVIQQENRRRLIATRLEGTAVLLAERFSESASLTVVLADRDDAERVLATRGYWRAGAVDWHAVLCLGEDSGWRGGAAFAWVATAALELHGSLLGAQRLEQVMAVPNRGLTDYRRRSGDDGVQALFGGSWTGNNKVSVLIELWRDERAWSRSEWRGWQARTRALGQTLPAGELRESAIALQARALDTPSLHRDNVLLRLAWTAGALSPSADVLYMPADDGMIATARLQWEGERATLEVGWRSNLGADSAVTRQLPSNGIAFLSAAISF